MCNPSLVIDANPDGTCSIVKMNNPAKLIAVDDELHNAMEAVAIAHRFTAMPPQAVQQTKRAPDLHLQDSANCVMPFAIAAEAESFASDAVLEVVDRLRGPK